jgi:hypothetical protein
MAIIDMQQDAAVQHHVTFLFKDFYLYLQIACSTEIARLNWNDITVLTLLK